MRMSNSVNSERTMDSHHVTPPTSANVPIMKTGQVAQAISPPQTPPKSSSWITNIQDAALAVVKHAPSGKTMKDDPISVTPPYRDYRLHGMSPSVSVQAYGTSLPVRPSYVTNKSKSASIPISPKSIRRTASENQLSEDEAMADYKDYIMYSRIVNGISRQNSQRKDVQLLYENQLCLGNIMRTRQYNVEDESSCYLQKNPYPREHNGGYSHQSNNPTMNEQFGYYYHQHQPTYPFQHHQHDLNDESTEHDGVFELDL